jgi:hypothetical protein
LHCEPSKVENKAVFGFGCGIVREWSFCRKSGQFRGCKLQRIQFGLILSQNKNALFYKTGGFIGEITTLSGYHPGYLMAITVQ